MGSLEPDVSEKPKTLQEIFDETCPQYLNMGMTAAQFWTGDPRLCIYYRKAYKKRKQSEFDEQNRLAWLQGQYNYAALCTALSNAFAKPGTKPHEYLDEPFKFYHNEAERIADEEAQKQALRDKVVSFFTNMK